MPETLYSKDILRLAMMIGDDRGMDRADGKAEKRAPLCGSRVQIGVKLDADQAILDISITASACAVGQASAAILKRYAAGLSVANVAQIRGQIESCLSGQSDMPDIWEELAALEPARDYPARHGAILLPYDTLLAAIADADGRAV